VNRVVGFNSVPVPFCERRIVLGRRYGYRHRDARFYPMKHYYRTEPVPVSTPFMKHPGNLPLIYMIVGHRLRMQVGKSSKNACRGSPRLSRLRHYHPLSSFPRRRESSLRRITTQKRPFCCKRAASVEMTVSGHWFFAGNIGNYPKIQKNSVSGLTSIDVMSILVRRHHVNGRRIKILSE